jgi:Flp pilus assembly protein TadD
VRRVVTALVTACALFASDASAQTSVRRALVVPFESEANDPRLVWLSEGVATLIADGLTAAGRPAFTRAERVRVLEELQLPVDVRLSYATLVRVAEVVDARSLITGRLALAGDRLTVRARRFNVDGGRSDPEIVEQGPIGELFAVCQRVVQRMAGRAPTSAGTQDAPPIDAFESYIKGLLAENPVTQARFLEAALGRHPGYAPARIALWSVQTEQQAHTKALEVVDTIPRQSPLSRTARFLGARSLIALKRYDEAFTRLTALAEEGATPAVLNNLGVVQLRRGATAQRGKPVYYFNKAAEAEPTNADYFFNLGYASWLDGDPKAATYHLREVVRRHPADGAAHLVLGAALHSTGQPAEAKRERDLARHLSSKFATDIVPRGLERVSEDLDPAPPELQSIVVTATQAESATLSQFHLERGQRFLGADQYREAIVELRKAIYLTPYDARVNLWLGRAYARAGRVREAIDAFKISIWGQDSPEARYALATSLLDSGDAAGARAQAIHALELDPGFTDARSLVERLDRRPPANQPHN